MSKTALLKLVESSKATVLVAVILVLGALLYGGYITKDDFLAMLQVLVPSWMVAHAGEKGAEHLANGKAKAAVIAAAEPIKAPEGAK
jgi:hypothetical protein